MSFMAWLSQFEELGLCPKAVCIVTCIAEGGNHKHTTTCPSSDGSNPAPEEYINKLKRFCLFASLQTIHFCVCFSLVLFSASNHQPTKQLTSLSSSSSSSAESVFCAVRRRRVFKNLFYSCHEYKLNRIKFIGKMFRELPLASNKHHLYVRSTHN